MKFTSTSIIVSGLLIAGGIFFTSGNSVTNNVIANNVSIVDGKQIIEITAKGGYLPRRSTAKAGIPTILRFNTKGTLDCSSAVRIPSLKISKRLPLSGVTDIDVGVSQVGLLKGMCSMGMYPFEVDFQS